MTAKTPATAEWKSGSGSGSGSGRKTQNPAGDDSGYPDPAGPLVAIQIASRLLKLHLFVTQLIKQIVLIIDQPLSYCSLIKY